MLSTKLYQRIAFFGTSTQEKLKTMDMQNYEGKQGVIWGT